MESRGVGGGVEEITCERVKGLNKRTGRRGRGGGVAQRDREGGSGGGGVA